MRKTKQHTFDFNFDLPMTQAEVLPMTHIDASNQPKFKDETQAFLATFHETGLVTAVHKAITDCHKTALTDMPETMMLIGDSGVGETLILHKYHEGFPTQVIDGQKKVPILYLLTPDRAKTKDIIIGLLEQLSDKLNIKGEESVLKRRLLTQLKLAGTVMVFLDEAQRLNHTKFGHSPKLAIELLTYVQDSSAIPFVLSGTKELLKLMTPEILGKHDKGGERIKELESFIRRARQTLIVPGYKITEKKWQGLLNKTLEAFPRSLLMDDKELISERIFIATQGRLGFFNKLFKEILEISEPRDVITLDVFSNAYKRITAVPLCGFNPFIADIKHINAYLKDALGVKGGKSCH
jgi:hypothetical protein